MFAFDLGDRIGSGSFGTVYKGQQPNVAVKVESKNTRLPQLLYEHRVLHLLRDVAGIPSTFGFQEAKEYNYMAMQLLGPNFQELLTQNGEPFCLKTTILIATQILSILQSVHEHHFIHRDIKPENFVIDDDNNVYLIDFGLAFKYRSPKTLEHIAYSENVKFRGTARFASRMAQLDVRQSRRDDLESLGYTLVYLLKGSLPWQNLRDDKKVIKKKIRMPFEILTKGLDPHLVLFFKHIDSLKFDQTPDYALLQDLLYEILRRSLTSSRGLPISPPCAVLTCDRYRQAPVSTRTDLCLPHSKLLCQFEECFRLKASRNSLHCVQHQRSCIECKALESDVCMNANGRCVKCYCEWNLHVAMLKFTCSKCKCTKFVPDDAFFALRCVQCSHATYYDPVVALDCFQTMTDKYPMVLSSAVSARKSTCI